MCHGLLPRNDAAAPPQGKHDPMYKSRSTARGPIHDVWEYTTVLQSCSTSAPYGGQAREETSDRSGGEDVLDALAAVAAPSRTNQGSRQMHPV
jgi:hypothetical protein